MFIIKVFIRNLTLIAGMQGFIHKGNFPLASSAKFSYVKIANDLSQLYLQPYISTVNNKKLNITIKQ